MGSINLGNLLMNMHTSAAANKNTNGISTTKEASEAGGFNEVLSKAKQNNASKSTDKKTSVISEDKPVTKKASKSSKSENTDLEKDEKAVKDEVASTILSILSEQLQLPVENITGTLEEIGLTPIDLLDENNFSQFITAFYEESSTEDLLMGNTQIKDISKLFTKMQEVSAAVVGDELHQVIEETTVSDEFLAKNTQTVVTNVGEEVTMPEAETLPGVEETLNSIWKPKEEKVVETKGVVGQNASVSQVLPMEQLGLSVPVEAFESAVRLTNDQVQTNHNMGGVHVNPDLNLTSQIVDHIEVTKLEQMQEIKLQLSPKELGQLTIKLVEKNGVLVAEIKVESERTKDFILSEINTLKNSLGEQGIDISNVQVDVRQNDSTTQMDQQKQKSSKRIQEIIAKHLQELEDEEAQVDTAPSLTVGEREIDYMI